MVRTAAFVEQMNESFNINGIISLGFFTRTFKCFKTCLFCYQFLDLMSEVLVFGWVPGLSFYFTVDRDLYTTVFAIHLL